MHAQNCLLGFLSQGPNYGYELKKMYDSLFGRDKPILPGQIYSTLSRLERDGKVEEVDSAAEKSAGPSRVKYQITDKGSEYFEQWLREPETVNPHLQTTMYFKIVLALMNNHDIAEMRELTKKRNATDDLATTLLIDNTIFHIEADLRWIELAYNRINQLREELCKTKA